MTQCGMLIDQSVSNFRPQMARFTELQRTILQDNFEQE